MKKILFFLLLAGLSHALCAQGRVAQLSGLVTDARTGAPLPGASLWLNDVRSGTTTDSNGRFVFRNLSLSHTIIEVSYQGYKTIVEHIDLEGATVHDFRLTPAVLRNEGVTVTAVASATSIRKAPIPITRVTKAELLATPSSNIIDALSRQPGVSQLSTGPAVSKPIIRGLGYNRLVVINDGIRQEGQQWGDEHGIEIDENSVSRVEIVKGPASLIYGSDALAGVINILTTNPVPDHTIRANVLSDYQTNNRQRSLFGSVGGNENGVNWNVWGDVKRAADYSNRYDGEVFNSKFREGNYGGYAGINRTWGYSHFIVSSFNQKLGMIEGERDSLGYFLKPVPGGGEERATDADFRSTEPQVPYQQINHLKLTSDNSFRLGKGRLAFTLAWQRNQRREFGDVDLPKVSSLYFDLKTVNYNLVYHLPEASGWNTSIGVNGMRQANENKGEEVLIPEYTLFDIGSFVYAQKSIGKTSFSGGLRFDRRSLDSKPFEENGDQKFTAFERRFSNFSASAGMSYAANENVVVKFNLAKGFRAPSIPELASNGTHEGTNRYEYGSQDLRSEKSFQADLGAEINSTHVLFQGSVFYNRINNFIFYSKLPAAGGGDSMVLVDGDLIQAFRFGQNDARLYGFEALVDIHPHPLDWLHWQNTFSYVRGQFLSDVEGVRDLPLIPAPRLISELRGEFLKTGKRVRNLNLHFEADRTFAQNDPFTAFDTETATPAYTLLHAGLNFDVMRRSQTLFSLYLNVQNIGDVAYQSHLSRLKYTAENPVTGRIGVFNRGRNFSFKINVPLSFSTAR